MGLYPDGAGQHLVAHEEGHRERASTRRGCSGSARGGRMRSERRTQHGGRLPLQRRGLSRHTAIKKLRIVRLGLGTS
jgi:hypothetical protein